MNKNFSIIETLKADPPFANLTNFSMSFLCADKIQQNKDAEIYGIKPFEIHGLENISDLNLLNIIGFIVYDGYNNYDKCVEHCQLLRKTNPMHDVAECDMGQLHYFGDTSKTNKYSYSDKKMNELEQSRRENFEKAKIVQQSIQNEYSIRTKQNKTVSDVRERLRKKLYAQGKISKMEYDKLANTNKSNNEIKKEIEVMEKLNGIMTAEMKTDYLDEHLESPFKYGLISIFTPSNVVNLKDKIFKLRGMYVSLQEASHDKTRLEKIYPKEPIYIFEIGKWIPYTDDQNMPDMEKLKRLNFLMKCHMEYKKYIDNEFTERKQKMMESNQKTNETTNINNKKKQKRNKKSQKCASTPDMHAPNTHVINSMDTQNISEIEKFLNDD